MNDSNKLKMFPEDIKDVVAPDLNDESCLESMTVLDLCAYWLVNYSKVIKSASSVERDFGIIKNYIVPRFANVQISQVNPRDVENWVAELKRNAKISVRSINYVVGTLKKMLTDAARWKFIDVNPLVHVSPLREAQKVMSAWTAEEAQVFVGSYLSKEEPERIYWPVVLALYTGMRRGEVQALRWNDVDRKRGLIRVWRTYCKINKKSKGGTKNGKIRYVPISATLGKLLDERAVASKLQILVVPFFSPEVFLREFHRISETLGLPIIRFHDLRHTFASNFLMAGGNLYDLQHMLGHSSVKVTEQYIHFTADHLKGKTDILSY
jgi:integrase